MRAVILSENILQISFTCADFTIIKYFFEHYFTALLPCISPRENFGQIDLALEQENEAPSVESSKKDAVI